MWLLVLLAGLVPLAFAAIEVCEPKYSCKAWRQTGGCGKPADHTHTATPPHPPQSSEPSDLLARFILLTLLIPLLLDPKGGREPRGDKGCKETIDAGASGYVPRTASQAHHTSLMNPFVPGTVSVVMGSAPERPRADTTHSRAARPARSGMRLSV
jgi:hypothetical protein